LGEECNVREAPFACGNGPSASGDGFSS
jgi:hypothetical protein